MCYHDDDDWGWNEAGCLDVLVALTEGKFYHSCNGGAGMALIILMCLWHLWLDSW
jgi:hypothetical protein